MRTAKYTFNDIHIGDEIVTTDNEKGIVIAIKSYSYLNDKIARKSNKILNEIMPFQFDEVLHKDIWYSAITIAVKTNDGSMYLVGLDLSEVKDIKSSHTSIKDKIKKYLHIL